MKFVKRGNTKIICTLGLSSESRNIIKKLLVAGMRGARLNFGHGSYQHHQLLINNIRQVSKDLDLPCAIIADLSGPKIRVGSLKKSIKLNKGEEVILIIESKIEKLLRKKNNLDHVIPLQYNLALHVKKGDVLLIDDGLVELKVSAVRDDYIKGQVKNSGVISSHKGINVPGREIHTPVITTKDKADLKFALQAQVDAIAISFVQTSKNITDLRGLIDQRWRQNQLKPFIIAKIERRAALENIDEIIEQADGVMIARGDLGLEIPPAEVPLKQKEIITKCLLSYKPVTVATQMLDSMIRNPRATRAEVSDVAGAVVDHADSLMLSGETALGKYPLEACRTMADIITRIEKSPYDNIEDIPLNKNASSEEALAHAAWSLSLEVKARAILATTISGKTARMIARFRPEMPIVVTCEDERVQRQLILSWGIMPFVLPKFKSVDKLIEAAVEQVKKSKIACPGDKIIIISGQPVGQAGANLVKVHTV